MTWYDCMTKQPRKEHLLRHFEQFWNTFGSLSKRKSANRAFWNFTETNTFVYLFPPFWRNCDTVRSVPSETLWKLPAKYQICPTFSICLTQLVANPEHKS
jgi:hypothetical protein